MCEVQQKHAYMFVHSHQTDTNQIELIHKQLFNKRFISRNFVSLTFEKNSVDLHMNY